MKLFEKDELKILWPFYLEYFIASILYFLPAFFTLYFMEVGLSFVQIGVLFAISPIVAVIFEILTGAFADIYGRKASVLLGYFLEGLCVLMLFFTKNYYTMVVLFAIWGIAATFSSGSKDSWIVDSINKKDKRLCHNFFKKQQIIINFGLIASGILGALFVKLYGVSIIWIATAISYLASILLLYFFASEEKVISKEQRIPLPRQIKETSSYGYKHHVLYYYLFATFIFAFASFFISSSLSYTPLLKNLNFPDYALGYVASLAAFVAMISPIFSKRKNSPGKERNFIIFCIILSAIIALFMLTAKNWVSIILIMMGVELFIGMRGPVSEVYFHRFIPSKMRATMTSIKAMLIALAAALSFLVRGYLIDLIGAKYTFVVYSVLIIPVVILYLKIKEKK